MYYIKVKFVYTRVTAETIYHGATREECMSHINYIEDNYALLSYEIIEEGDL